MINSQVLKAFVPLPDSDVRLPGSSATDWPAEYFVAIPWYQDVQVFAKLFDQVVQLLVDLSQLLNDQVHLR